MPNQHDRSRIEADRADRQVIEQAAAQLRSGAIRAGYAGLERKELALILDELARHLRDLDDPLRGRVVEACGQLLGRT